MTEGLHFTSLHFNVEKIEFNSAYQILGWLYELTTVILEARKWQAKSSSKSYILNKCEIIIVLLHCRILRMPLTPEQPTAHGKHQQHHKMSQCDLALGTVYFERFIFRGFYQGTLIFLNIYMYLQSQHIKKDDLKYPDTLKLRKYISPSVYNP